MKNVILPFFANKTVCTPSRYAYANENTQPNSQYHILISQSRAFKVLPEQKNQFLNFSEKPMKVRLEASKTKIFLKVQTESEKKKTSQEDKDGMPTYPGEQ